MQAALETAIGSYKLSFEFTKDILKLCVLDSTG